MLQKNPRTYKRADSIPTLKETLWLIQDGIVRTTICTSQGKLTALGYWGKDDIVGHPLNKVESLQIECVTEVQAVPLLKDEWSFYVPAILKHSEQTTRLMSYVTHESTTQRLVNILVWLGSRFGISVNQGLLIDLPMSHAALAEMIGTSRVSVTRILGELAKQGVILQSRNKQIVLLKDLNSLDVQFITCQVNQYRKTSYEGQSS